MTLVVSGCGSILTAADHLQALSKLQANLLCTQVNSAFYPQRDKKRVVLVA